MDILPTGAYHSNNIQVTAFVSNIYKKKSNIVIDIIRGIVILAIVALYEIDIISGYFSKRRNNIRNDLFKMLLIYLLLILFIVSLVIKLHYLTNDDNYFFSDYLQTYTDSYKISKRYRYMLFLESIFLLITLIKAFTFAQLFNITTLIFSSIGHTLMMYFQFLIVLLCVLFALTSIAEIIWGPYLDEFKTFGLSFISILLFTSSYMNISKLLEYDMVWGILFIIITFLLQMFIFMTFFASIFAESLRRCVCTYGYPEDHEESKWDLDDYKVWLIHFIKDPKAKKEESDEEK